MTYAIVENLTEKPLWLRLNSGVSVQIGSRSRSHPILTSELADNDTLTKLIALQEARQIEAHAGQERAPRPKKVLP